MTVAQRRQATVLSSQAISQKWKFDGLYTLVAYEEQVFCFARLFSRLIHVLHVVRHVFLVGLEKLKERARVCRVIKC